MLQIIVPKSDLWDERNEEFISSKEQVLNLEHSLISLSKWESKWCKSFFSDKEEKSYEEIIDYIKCMTLTQNVKPVVYSCLTSDNIEQINKYIEAPMTATYFSDNKTGRSRRIITSELIYYWMIALNIPFECQKWHLNRLLTLIRVCETENQPGKKMSKRDVMNRYSSLNDARRKALHSRG